MESVGEMANFISLWDLVQNVQLTNEQDAIRWKWTAHGEYTTKSEGPKMRPEGGEWEPNKNFTTGSDLVKSQVYTQTLES